MAISVPYDLKGLKKISEELGLEIIPSGKNGRYMKEDYIIPIREYYLNELYGDNIPNYMDMILERNSVMLAVRIDKFDEETQKEVMENDEFYYEEKLNGLRAVIIKSDGKLTVFSRHSSAETLLPVEYTDNILSIVKFNNEYYEKLNQEYEYNFMLDSEMDMTDWDVEKMKKAGYLEQDATKLQAMTTLMNSLPERALKIQRELNLNLRFNVFDCMNYKNLNIDRLPLIRRKNGADKIREMVMKVYPSINFQPVEEAHGKDEKEAFLKRMILTGREGVVAKDPNSTYRSDGNRGLLDWVKIKPSVSYRNRIMQEEIAKRAKDEEESEIFNGNIDGLTFSDFGFENPKEPKYKDTIDAWITDYIPGKGNFEGMIGAVELTTWIVKKDGSRYKHPIAWISGFDLETRQDMTEVVKGEVRLKKEYYGKVWEIDGQGISHANKRLNHARLITWRDDKSSEDCETPEEILDLVV